MFDGMMTSRAAVYRQDNVEDGYGATSTATFVRINVVMPDGTIQDYVPCLPKSLKGEELNTWPAPVSQTSHGLQQYEVFMRMITVDDPAVDLNIKHWLQILSKKQLDAGQDFLDMNDANSGAIKHNVTNISNPAGMGHHLEVTTTVIIS